MVTRDMIATEMVWADHSDGDSVQLALGVKDATLIPLARLYASRQGWRVYAIALGCQTTLGPMPLEEAKAKAVAEVIGWLEETAKRLREGAP